MGPADYLNWKYERALLTGTGSGAAGGMGTFKTVFGSNNHASDTLN